MPLGFTAETGRYDATVIGAGTHGTAIALELSRRGVRTVVVDRMAGPGDGSTGDSAAIVRGYATSPEMTVMSADAMAIWKAWPDFVETTNELGLARYIRTGSVLLKSHAGHHEAVVQTMDALGMPYEDWDFQALQDRLPCFDVHSFWPPRPIDDPSFYDDAAEVLEGAVFVREGGYISDPRLAAHNLALTARAHGATFLFRSVVVSIDRRADRVTGVRLADGRSIHSDVVVNAAGPHSAGINRLAGVQEDMTVSNRPLRHELDVVPAPKGFKGADGIAVSDGDLGINFRPEGTEHILVGSEDPPCDPLVWVDDPDEHDRNVRRSQWERQVYRLARRIPTLGIPNSAIGLAGLYDVTPDSMPIYDRSSLDGYYMAIGTNGNQFKTAPVVGRLIAELIVACENGHDHDAHPLQMPATTVNATIDMGRFSRNRKLPSSLHIAVV
jgi:sarcosine oxidase subunit beta